MKIKIKKKYQLKILRKISSNKFCFLIISGKQKILSEIFGKNSVLHISCFKRFIDMSFLVSYAFSYVCIFKLKDFFKILEYYYDRRFTLHQICVNNSFINFHKLLDCDKFYFLKNKILIFNLLLVNIYFLIYMILNFLLNLIEVMYLLLQKKC